MDPRQKSESDEVSAEKRIGLDELFTDKEAARVLRMSQVTLWRERKEGKITFRRYAGKLFYTRTSSNILRERKEDLLIPNGQTYSGYLNDSPTSGVRSCRSDESGRKTQNNR